MIMMTGGSLSAFRSVKNALTVLPVAPLLHNGHFQNLEKSHISYRTVLSEANSTNEVLHLRIVYLNGHTH